MQNLENHSKRAKTFKEQMIEQVSFTNFVILTLLLIAAPVIYGEITKDAVLIDPFNVPSDFEKMGYSGHVMADKLAEKINVVIKEADISRKGRSFTLSSSESLPDIEVPETKISLQSIARYLRQFFKKNPAHIDGHVTLSPANKGELHLYVQVTSEGDLQAKSFDGKLENLDVLFLDCAKYVLRRTEPLALAAYMYSKGLKHECLGLIQYCIYKEPHVIQGKYSKDAPWAYNLWGYLLDDDRDFSGAISKYKAAVDLDRNFADAYLGWGSVLDEQRDFDGATAMYKKAIELNKLSGAYVDLGYVLLNVQHNYIDALEAFENAIKSDPENSYAYVGRSFLWMAKAEYDKAIADDRTALEVKSDSAEAHIAWGSTLYYKRDYNGAILELQQAIEAAKRGYDNSFNEASAYRMWGVALLGEGDFGHAAEKFRKSSELNKYSADVFNDWGNMLAWQSNNLDAISKYQQALIVAPRYALADSSWSYVLTDQGDYSGALAKCQEAISIDPYLAVAYQAMANVQRANGDYVGALESLQKASKIDPLAADFDVDAGNICIETGKNDGAIEYYGKALAKYPYNSNAYVNWGNALFGQNKEQDALEKYGEALSKDPYSASAYLMLANVLRDKGDRAEATRKYQKAIDLNPYYADAYDNWGSMLVNAGNRAAAVSKLEHAIRLNPRLASAYNNLGNALVGQRKYKSALVKYQKATELNPNLTAAYLRWGDTLSSLQKYTAAKEKYDAVVALDGSGELGDQARIAIDKLQQKLARAKARVLDK
jgi:tetratricopeptide (TPR) repeat protein